MPRSPSLFATGPDSPANSVPTRLSLKNIRSRIQVYAGDVGLPNCGLDAPTWDRLSAEVTRVIHSAATVRFDHTLDEARRINVEGTRRLLDFAAGARDLKCMAYVGTAYVAGERSGLVREDELDVGQSFRNTYEQTKSEAEALVRSRLGSLPAVILRPSIIVGDSRTGETSSFKMMYWPLKIYARRLWRTVPGYPDAVLDIVPVDYVAAAVACLAFNEAALGSAVHLCAGPHGAATIQQIAKRAAEFFHVREPRYVDPNLFFATVRPILFMALWGRKRRVLRDGRAYRDYFTMKMQFDTSNAERSAWARRPYAASGSRLPRSPLSLLRGQRLGPQTSHRRMNIFRRYQLAKDPGLTVSNLLDELLRRRGDGEASVGDNGAVRLSELHHDVCAIDAFLRRTVGLQPGQAVAVYRTNDRSCFHWFLAIARAGGIAMPLNPMLSLPEVRRILDNSSIEILVTDKACFDRTIRTRESVRVKTWIQVENELAPPVEKMEGFLEKKDDRRVLSALHHRSNRDDRGFPHLGNERLSQGSGALEQRAAGRPLIHGAGELFSRAEGPGADRAPLVAHHGHQHRSQRPGGRHSRMPARSIRC